MKQLLIFTGALMITASSYSQNKGYNGIPSLVWPKLFDITYTAGQDEFGELQIPVFTEKVKAMSGKVISLPGYMIPFEGGFKETHFILSALPLNACFFCGTGGPETVIEVFCNEKVPYTEKPVEVSGILKINNSDPDKMVYILENARFLGTVDF
ncbi:MAG: DUF3299 domain-containing protein [Cyclobacteriaceae bacterium]|nr:DUF3299 domain-containing protein [Cyclobacteriaceae bacterium]